MNGLKLVGEIQVAPGNDEVLVRDFDATFEHVDIHVDAVAGKQVAQQAAPPADEEKRAVEKCQLESEHPEWEDAASPLRQEGSASVSSHHQEK